MTIEGSGSPRPLFFGERSSRLRHTTSSTLVLAGSSWMVPFLLAGPLLWLALLKLWCAWRARRSRGFFSEKSFFFTMNPSRSAYVRFKLPVPSAMGRGEKASSQRSWKKHVLSAPHLAKPTTLKRLFGGSAVVQVCPNMCCLAVFFFLAERDRRHAFQQSAHERLHCCARQQVSPHGCVCATWA